MKIVAVVPIKLNSVRLPQKNIKNFKNGKPLCWYILNTLLNCDSIDEVYVYCSNPSIADYIPAEVKYLKRDKTLDFDSTKINEVLYSFAQDVSADIYLMSHATAPFITAGSIEKGIAAVKSPEYDSSFAVKKIQDFIWKDGKPFNYKLDNIPRTQDLDPLFMETSGFYIYTKELIIEHKRRIGEKPFLVEVNEIESCDIDEYEDFYIADAINYYKQCEVASQNGE